MSIIDLVFPKMATKIIDNILPAKNIKFMIKIGFFLLLLFIVRYILGYIVDYYGHTLGTKIEFDMRQDVFNHIQELSFTFFDNNKTGHIMSRIVNDLNEISELSHHGPEDLFIALVTFIGSFVILLKMNWKLSLIIFSILPIMFGFALNKSNNMKKAFYNTRVKTGDINAQLEDSISGIREVKAFTNEDYEKLKFKVGNKGVKQAKQGSYKAMAEFFSGMNFFTNFMNLLVLMVGGWLCYTGELTTGELLSFFLYISMFFKPIRKMVNFIETYQNGMAGFSRFVDLMELQPDIVDKPDAINLKKEQVKGHICFDDVTFSYNDSKKVFSNISFNISPGETVAFVGPSGAGKTTLVSLIPRFYEIDKGNIAIDGINIKDVTLKSLRQNIGIVRQDVFLFTGTIRENIAYGKPDARSDEIIEAAKQAKAHDFIIGLKNGYDTYIGQRGAKLSGGQKQRIAISRIFLKNPPILILDEATSALDNETEQLIQESLFDLAKDRTTLIIAHRLATIRRADHIFVLTEKGIKEQGTHRELLNQKGLYHELYTAQFTPLNS